jgi:hypothetical protein
MTLISMNKYLIEVNHFKYERIRQNMQEKISDICLLFRSKYPSLGYLPIGGGNTLLPPNKRETLGDIYSDRNRNIWQILLKKTEFIVVVHFQKIVNFWLIIQKNWLW